MWDGNDGKLADFASFTGLISRQVQDMRDWPEGGKAGEDRTLRLLLNTNNIKVI